MPDPFEYRGAKSDRPETPYEPVLGVFRPFARTDRILTLYSEVPNSPARGYDTAYWKGIRVEVHRAAEIRAEAVLSSPDKDSAERYARITVRSEGGEEVVAYTSVGHLGILWGDLELYDMGEVPIDSILRLRRWR